jgi:hypothetical protein
MPSAFIVLYMYTKFELSSSYNQHGLGGSQLLARTVGHKNRVYFKSQYLEKGIFFSPETFRMFYGQNFRLKLRNLICSVNT